MEPEIGPRTAAECVVRQDTGVNGLAQARLEASACNHFHLAVDSISRSVFVNGRVEKLYLDVVRANVTRKTAAGGTETAKWDIGHCWKHLNPLPRFP
jgi:hypothetical protein